MNALAIREKLQALSASQKLLLGVGGATLLLGIIRRKDVMSSVNMSFDFAKAQAFKLALPKEVARWSTELLNAAKQYDVSPWALAAIMYGESRGGAALSPANDPAGTGDFAPRWNPATGKASSIGWQHANPATGLPPDGKGWGRGLMQIDYGVHIDWMKSGARWWEPQVNINKAAELLREKVRYFTAKPAPGTTVAIEQWRVTTGKPQYGIEPWSKKYPRSSWPAKVADPRPLSGAKLYEASIAAYNVSYGAVLQAIGLGLPAEAGTAHQSYVTKFMARIADWQKRFS